MYRLPLQFLKKAICALSPGEIARLGSSGWPTGWPKYSKPAETSWWLDVHSPLLCWFTSSIHLTNYYCKMFPCLSFFVLFLPLVFTVHYCVSQRVISRRGRHLGDTVGLLLAAGVQQQQLLIAPLMLDLENWKSGRNSHPQTHHPAGREGGRNLKAEWPTPTAPFCALKTCISIVLTAILQLPSRCPCSTALNDGKAK